MRQLASIQRILLLEPIPGADAIEKATVLGWQVVVKKNEFMVGDLCVYLEIDSILPERPVFEFLRSKNFRIRTTRLRGQVSQGICFPLSILPPYTTIMEGADVTAILGVEKYEPPVPANLKGMIKGTFPSCIPKTDETRVQVLQELLDEHRGRKAFITEKLDGSSITCFINRGVFGVCSRNLELHEQADNAFWRAARALDIEQKLRALNRDIALQGELVGEGIQGNKLRLKGQTIFVFSIFFIKEYRYADFDEWLTITGQLGLQPVPVIADDYVLAGDIPSVLEKAVTRSMICPDVWAEGIVVRLKGSDEHISFKAINPEFLLKYDE
jgi:RNA ligase (TIGR02306 family)